MKKLHLFFLIGTIVIGLLHITFALILGLTAIHLIFLPIYITFISFLFIGAGLSNKRLT